MAGVVHRTLLAFFALTAVAAAQEYPTRPVTMVSCSPPAVPKTASAASSPSA